MMRTAFCIGLIAVSLVVAAPSRGHIDTVTPRFVALKALVGTWRTAGKPDSPLRVRFSLTADATVLVEEWTRNGQPHSLTLYHRDGTELIATHYCPQGNQPRLTLLPQVKANVLRFVFKDATDLDAAHEAHAVALAFDLSDQASLVRRETYRQGGIDEASELRLVRDR